MGASPRESVMRHPFDGVEVPAAAKPHRRSLLKGLLAAVGGLFAWKAAAQAEVIIRRPAILPLPPGGGPATAAINEAGGPVVGGGPGDPEPPDFRMSTAVRGEEGASV